MQKADNLSLFNGSKCTESAAVHFDVSWRYYPFLDFAAILPDFAARLIDVSHILGPILNSSQNATKPNRIKVLCTGPGLVSGPLRRNNEAPFDLRPCSPYTITTTLCDKGMRLKKLRSRTNSQVSRVLWTCVIPSKTSILSGPLDS